MVDCYVRSIRMVRPFFFYVFMPILVEGFIMDLIN